MARGPNQKDTKAANDTTATERSPADLSHPSHLKPWEDRSLPPEERLNAYKQFVLEKVAEILAAADRVSDDPSKVLEIRDDPETTRWTSEASELRNLSPQDFCKRIDRPEVRELLGMNFLGSEAWSSQGVEVGAEPRIPMTITKELLESECPFHPGEKIKDTHVLMLVPETVNGEAYTAFKLDELSARWEQPEDRLLDDDWLSWKSAVWATAPQTASEWVLIPKSDPEPNAVAPERHFRDKNRVEQDEVHKLYPEYREAKALEVMTLALMYYLVKKEKLLPDHYLRCEDTDDACGRVCVGFFAHFGLQFNQDDGFDNDITGRALARKL
jgi:hypothetical protein